MDLVLCQESNGLGTRGRSITHVSFADDPQNQGFIAVEIVDNTIMSRTYVDLPVSTGPLLELV